jgi:hypothetical protein
MQLHVHLESPTIPLLLGQLVGGDDQKCIRRNLSIRTSLSVLSLTHGACVF